MKIALLNAHYWLGGAETVMHQLHRGFQEAGHDSTLLIGSGKGVQERRDLKLLYPPLLNRSYYSRLHQPIARIAPLEQTIDRAVLALARSKYDVIHLHNLGGIARLETLATLATSKPLIWTFHAYWNERSLPSASPLEQLAQGIRPQFDPFLERPLSSLQSFTALAAAPLNVVTVSQQAYESTRTLAAQTKWKITCIRNGITIPPPPDRAHLKLRLGFDPGKRLLLSVNRDFGIGDKGFPMVKEALEMVRPRDVEVMLIGRNSCAAASDLTIGVPVHAREFIADPLDLQEYYGAADVLLFASHHENFPCVTLEAMASACCVVATPTGGIKEQIEHRRSGFLASEISGAALAAALSESLLCSEIDMIRAQGKKRVASEFSEARMVADHLQFYQELIATQGR